MKEICDTSFEVRSSGLDERGEQGLGDELTQGFVNLKLGNLSAARASFSQAAARQPGLAMAHAGEALACQLLGHPMEALPAVNRALALDAHDLVALKVLARINLDMGLLQAAQGLCSKILQINSGDPDATAMLAQAVARLRSERNRPARRTGPNYDAYVSLGFNCEPGLQFQRIGHHSGSFFRFTFSPYETTFDLIKHDFADVFLRENLIPLGGTTRMVRDVKYNLTLHSDLPSVPDAATGVAVFSTGPDFDRLYRQEFEKVQYLAGKWRSQAASSQRVLYVIKHEGGQGRARGEELLGLFNAKYPQHDFRILLLQTEEQKEADWKQPRLTNRYLSRFNPLADAHDADIGGWDRIFAEFPLKEGVRSVVP
jgi:hypothetical protein